MSSELVLLRSALQDLQSYELPATYRVDPNNDHGATTTDTSNGMGESNDEPLLRRYKSARNAYIQQRTLDKFLESLQEYDPDSNTLPLPAETDESAKEKEELTLRKQQMLELVKGTMGKITEGMGGVQRKWQQFEEKREELAQIVEGMERGERKRRLEEGYDEGGGVSNDDGGGGNNHEDGEEDIADDDVALQEEKLDELQRRKVALENRLRSVRAEILDAEDDCHRSKRAVNEFRVRGGRRPLDWRGWKSNADGESNGNENGKSIGDDDTDGEDVEYISVLAQGIDAEIAAMEDTASELKSSCDFYDGIRELMEELGGVKILASASVPPASQPSNAENGVVATSVGDGESPRKRPKSGNSNGKEVAGEGFTLTLLLLGSHILEITLSKSPPSSSNKEEDGQLYVSNAELTTRTTLPITTDGDVNNETTTSLMESMHSVSLSNQSFSKIMSQKPAVEVSIPPLDDLVSWGRSLQSNTSSSNHGIRFVLVETLARLRTLEARVDELSTLQDTYAAQVYDVDPSSFPGGGGLGEQEVVCAINEGITVALRLGADCPLVPGSVYVSEMYGVGGWEEEQLQALRKVVLDRRCRGPVEVMECLVEEICRRSQGGEDEGWVVPATPSLPRGKY